MLENYIVPDMETHMPKPKPIYKTKLRALIKRSKFFCLEDVYQKLSARREVNYCGLYRKGSDTFLYMQTKTPVSPLMIFEATSYALDVECFDTIEGKLLEEIGKMKWQGRGPGKYAPESSTPVVRPPVPMPMPGERDSLRAAKTRRKSRGVDWATKK